MSDDLPDLDLTSLHFLPAWAKESETPKRYSNYETSEKSSHFRPKQRFSGNKPSGNKPPHSKKPFRSPDSQKSYQPFPKKDFTQPQPVEIPGLKVNFIPEEKGLLSLARQIKLTSRAYPVFDIARMILQKTERYYFQLETATDPNATSLYTCSSDNSIWLSEDEALKHLLNTQFDTYYKTEKIAVDPPKGNFTGLAVCGFSGKMFGPPNHHDYSNQVRNLYKERFSNMPFEKYKNRIKIVTDEATINKWKEEQSFRAEYHPLQNAEGSEVTPLKSRGEVETHFKTHHLPQLAQKVTTAQINQIIQSKLSRPLFSYLRNVEQEERRFPIRLVHYLSQELGKQGLKFFKAHKNITYTAIARPQYLDPEQTPVSDSIKHIIDFIQNNPKPNRYQLLTALTQTSGDAPPSTNPSELSPQEVGVLRDLHWLIQQGHVIEFANGQLELARKPKPKPEPTPPKSAETPKEETPLTTEDVSPDSETVSAASSENSASTEVSFSQTAKPTTKVNPVASESKSEREPETSEESNISPS